VKSGAVKRARSRENGGVISAQFVQSSTTLAAVLLVPELRLHLATDIYSVWEGSEAAAGQTEQPPPFWSVAWPGGQALARYLLDHPDVVQGRRVLDYGAGSGLVALAAARAGAAAVVACEPDPLARTAITLNAAANELPVPECVPEVTAGGPVPEVIVAGDVWYERGLAEQVSGYLSQATAAGARVLIGDIGDGGRKYFPRTAYQKLVSYELPSTLTLEGKETVGASVWQPAG
jgi:predicted nicotinamide N-methyase